MTAFTFSQDASSTFTLTDGSDSVSVTTTAGTSTAGNAGGQFGNSDLYFDGYNYSGVETASALVGSVAFAQEVGDFTFKVFDVDQDNWDDQVRVVARDAYGALTEITYTRDGLASGSRIDEDGASGTFVAEGSDVPGADFTITIPGPVLEVFIYYEDGDANGLTNDLGFIGIGEFDVGDLNAGIAPPPSAYVVDGTDDGDIIGVEYTGDTDNDFVDATDNATNDDDDIINGYGGDDTVYGGTGDDLIDGGSGDDLIYADDPDEISRANVRAGSGNFTGTDGTGDFTHTSTSSSTTLKYNYPGDDRHPNGHYFIGDNVSKETHTHEFSTEVAGARITTVGLSNVSEPGYTDIDLVTIYLDGVAIDLNAALADGSISIVESTYGTEYITPDGELTDTLSNNRLVIDINVPFTTLAIENDGSGANNGFSYDVMVETGPPGIVDGDDTVLGGSGSDEIYGGEGIDILYGDNNATDIGVQAGSFEGISSPDAEGFDLLPEWDTWNTASPDLMTDGVEEAPWFAFQSPTGGENFAGLVKSNVSKEGISQDLSSPLKAGMLYTITLDAASGGIQLIPGQPNEYSADHEVTLEIWGNPTAGATSGSQDGIPSGSVLLGTATVTSSEMSTFEVSFTPLVDINSISISLDGDTSDGPIGLMVDNISLDATAGGDDFIDGGLGDDFIYGEAGDDSLLGGEGNDSIIGGTGNDTLGGSSRDDQYEDAVFALVNGGSGVLAGTNNGPDISFTSVLGDPGATISSFDTDYFIGYTAGDDPVNTHVFSQEIVSATLQVKFLDPSESNIFYLDGVAIDLNEAIANGDVTLTTSGFNAAIITPEGGLSSTVNSSVTTLNINMPFTTFEVRHFDDDDDNGFSSYNLQVNTNPPDYVDAGGSDTLEGGIGDDTFIYHVGAGADTITDFGRETGSFDDGDQSNNDFVDLSAFYTQENYDAAVLAGDVDPAVIKNPLQWMRADQSDDGVLNGSQGDAGFASGDSLTLSGVQAQDMTFDNTNVICFVKGTRIATAIGEIPVEKLSVGDKVLTRDNGLRKICWIGSTQRKAEGKLAPILFKQGVINNHSDLLVSPNHRMLLIDGALELFVGEPEGLVAAKFFVDGEGVQRLIGGTVEYFHILFENHEIIMSEGCWTESFHPGHVGWTALTQSSRLEILELFPQLRTEQWEIARTVLKRPEAACLLLQKH